MRIIKYQNFCVILYKGERKFLYFGKELHIFCVISVVIEEGLYFFFFPFLLNKSQLQEITQAHILIFFYPGNICTHKWRKVLYVLQNLSFYITLYLPRNYVCSLLVYHSACITYINIYAIPFSKWDKARYKNLLKLKRDFTLLLYLWKYISIYNVPQCGYEEKIYSGFDCFLKVLYSQDITDQLPIVNFLSTKTSWFSTALWSAYVI